MNGIEGIVNFIWPTLQLQGTSWVPIWRQRERERFENNTRPTLIFGALAYILHFFLVDCQIGVHPLWRWASYRFGLAGLMIGAYIVMRLPAFKRVPLYRGPFLLVGFSTSYCQALSMTWDGRVPFYFAVVIPTFVALLLNWSPLASVGFLATAFALQWRPVLEAVGPGTAVYTQVVSSFVLATVIVMALRLQALRDVELFMKEQQLQLEQKKTLEAKQELVDQIRAFLPREIFARIMHYNSVYRMNLIQAIDEVLRVRSKFVACLYTDIRGFTRDAKDMDGYLLGRALPNIRIVTEITEAHRGIPRLIGDLVFAYFDDEVSEEALMHAVSCAVEIVEKNRQFNLAAGAMWQVRRFVLLSFGEALVGNIGGNDSSREITSLGSTVNILSRIDALTKEDAVRRMIPADSLVLTNAAAAALRQIFPELLLTHLDLPLLGVQIRDFPEETSIWCLTLADALKLKDATRDPIDAHENNNPLERAV